MDEQLKRVPQVLPHNRMHLELQKHQVWLARVESWITLDDLLDHNFWIHKPPRMLPFDEIKVYPEDGRWRAHLHVIESDETGLVLDVISFVEFPRVDAMRDAGGLSYRIKSAGPGKGYQIERADGVTTGGFASRQAAEEHLRNSAPSIARSA